MVRVEVDMYSGRPNPAFAVPADELARRLAALSPAAAGATVRDGLGYRGLRIDAPDAGVAEAMVSGGVVELHGSDGRVDRRADPGRALERWLVEAGVARLTADEAAMLRADLAR